MTDAPKITDQEPNAAEECLAIQLTYADRVRLKRALSAFLSARVPEEQETMQDGGTTWLNKIPTAIGFNRCRKLVLQGPQGNAEGRK